MEYVDLGLSSGTLWATCNVGASKPEEYGDYSTFEEAQKYDCPSKEQFKELIDNCTWTWSNINGVNGYKATSNKVGYTDKSIFLPAVGCRYDTFLDYVGSFGYYWSSSLGTGSNYNAWYLIFGYGYRYMDDGSRYFGQSVRPIKEVQQRNLTSL